MEKKISDNDYLIVRDKEIKNKLLLKSKDRLFFENNKKLKDVVYILAACHPMGCSFIPIKVSKYPATFS